MFAALLSLLIIGAGCVRDTGMQETASSPSQVSGRVFGAIDLSGQGLTALPADVLKRSDVTTLDISDNQIGGALPAEIRFMQSLQVIDASGNRMTGVPAEIGQLSGLRILDLSDNELTGLPYELGNLQKLETLDVSGNAYSAMDLDRIINALPTTTTIRR